jgi:hypothetical protein
MKLFVFVAFKHKKMTLCSYFGRIEEKASRKNATFKLKVL